MDEQQFSGYLELIYSLLTCKAGTKQAVYQQYSQLVDELLPKSMLRFAEQYKQVEEPLKMAWLRREAGTLSARIDEWNQLSCRVVELYQQGERASAIPFAKQALGLARNIFPSPNNNLTASLNNIAEMYYAQEQWADAVPFYEEIIAVYLSLDKDISSQDLVMNLVSLGICLGHLGQVYRDLEKWADAVPFYEKILDIHRTISTYLPDNSQLNSINNLANLYYSLEIYVKAEPLLKEALAINEILYGDTPSKDLASSLHNLGALYYAQGRWAEAEPYCIKALAIHRTLCGNQPNRDLIFEITNLAMVYYYQGELAKANSLFEEVLIVCELLFDEISEEDLVEVWNTQGEFYYLVGQWTKAQSFCEKALATCRILYSEFPNSQLVYSLNNQAELYRAQGKWTEAEPLYEEAISLCQTLLGKLPKKYLATSSNNLGALYAAQGKWIKAEPLYEKALAIRRIIYGEFPHNDVSISLSNVAGIYCIRGELDKAELFYQEARSILQTISKDRPHFNIGINLSNLAGLYLVRGEVTKAQRYYEEALRIHNTVFEDRHNKNVGGCLFDLGEIHYIQRKWAKAKRFYEEAITIYQILFGETGHPDLVEMITTFASAYAQQQQPSTALSLFQQAISCENKWITNVIAINDAEQRMKDLQQRQPRIEWLLSLTQQYFLNDPKVVADVFNAVLSRKAQAATAEANFSKALRNQPALAPDIEEYQACQKEIATLSYAIGDRPDLKDRLNTLLEQRRNLEKKLARSIPAINLAQQVIDRQALTELLPADAFLVEFVRYRDYDFIKRARKAARYLAFIVRHDRAGVTAINCGLAEPLDEAIKKFRSVFADSDFSGERSGFDDMFNQPALAPQPEDPTLPDLLTLLLPHLPTSGTCYLAPDGDLHLLPFHLLKTADGKYLGDRYHLHHLATARDLYRQKFPTSTNPPAIFADPDYDGGILPTAVASSRSGMEYNHDVCGKPFARLDINRILGKAIATAYQVPCYTDIEATVDRLDRLKAPQVLAIATHGFTLYAHQDLIEQLIKCPVDTQEKVLHAHRNLITPEFRDFWHQAAANGKEWCQCILAKIDKVGIYTQDPATFTSNSIDLLRTPTADPMLHSGIALAGANIWRFQGTETEQFGKGVVFAHDIAQWDLWGTELALMITCVSGLGAIKNSEGVFGLRRALLIAGAKYVITSLWNIPTKPSVLLMNKFFELYLSAARPTPPQALAQAQSYIRNITLGELRQLEEVGQAIVEELQRETVRKLSLTATDDVKPLADPHFWGAWICQG